MNNHALVSFSFCLLSHAAVAQSIEKTAFSFQHSATDGAQCTIRNNSSSAITAWLISTSHFDNTGKRRSDMFGYLDSVVNYNLDQPLLPGQQRQILLAPKEFVADILKSGGRLDATLVGAIFQDGSLIGSHFGRQVLVVRRVRLIAELENAQRLLIGLDQTQDIDRSLSALESSAKTLRDIAARTSNEVDRAILMVSGLVPHWILSSVKQSDSTCGVSCRHLTVLTLVRQVETWHRTAVLSAHTSPEP